MKGYKSIKVN